MKESWIQTIHATPATAIYKMRLTHADTVKVLAAQRTRTENTCVMSATERAGTTPRAATDLAKDTRGPLTRREKTMAVSSPAYRTHYYAENNDRPRLAVGYVGENGIKADTWYAVKVGKLVEVKP